MASEERSEDRRVAIIGRFVGYKTNFRSSQNSRSRVFERMKKRIAKAIIHEIEEKEDEKIENTIYESERDYIIVASTMSRSGYGSSQNL